MEESAPKRRRTSASPSREDATPSHTLLSSPRRPRRPSFASPTKSSMERFHPSVLERRRSASPTKSPAHEAVGQTRFPASQPLGATTTMPFRSASAAQQSPERQRSVGKSRSPTRPTAAGGMTAAPRRSPSKPIPSPRPMPRERSEDNENFNPFQGREIRRMDAPTEPSLPPSADDNVASSSPRGIHSSPSQRWRYREGAPQSSPLKQPPSRPDDVATTLFPSKSPKKSSAKSRSAQAAAPAEDPVVARDTDVRKKRPFDVYAGQKKERDELMAELAQLKKDLQVVGEENKRIRIMQESGRSVASNNEKGVMDIVKRYLVPHELNARPKSQLLAVAALDPMAVLPSNGKPAAVPLEEEQEDDYSQIRSHHPVQMTAAEELPFLQVFTPFDVTSTLVTLPKESDKSALHQRFGITLRSRHAPGLFNARMDVEVEAMSLTITSLDVRSLEPAARPELASFLRRICEGDCNRSMQHNVGIASWAMAEWLRVAEERARFWVQLDRRTRSKKALRDVSSNARKGKRSRKVDGEGGAGGGANDSGGGGATTAAELMRFMGQQGLDVALPLAKGKESKLRLEWKIEFDWTGEAQSKLAVLAGVPGEWHNVDDKGTLGRIPLVFQTLIDGGEEPVSAAQKMIALLAGDV